MKVLSNYEINTVSGGIAAKAIQAAAYGTATLLISGIAQLATVSIAHDAGLDNLNGKSYLSPDFFSINNLSSFLGLAVGLAVSGVGFYNAPEGLWA